MNSPTIALDTESFIGLLNSFNLSSRALKVVSQFIPDSAEVTGTSITFDQSYRSVEHTLDEVALSAKESNWDGYGAEPVKEISIFFAKSFLHNLPSTYPKPEVSVDPDGEISFEWLNKNDKIFSVSFNQENEISFAGIYSTGEDHGTEEFNGYEIPKKILENIKRLSL